MEDLYAKLYERYTKLKAKKDSEIERLNRDQEAKFMKYVSASEELVEHLRSEYDNLCKQNNELVRELVAVKSSMDEQSTEFHRLMMEESCKNKELVDEIGRLKSLKQDNLCSPSSGKRCRNESVQDDHHAAISVTPIEQFPLDSVLPSSTTGVTAQKESEISGACDENWNCMFRTFTEHIVGLKLSAEKQSDGMCISAQHQSSGYSFSLTWVKEVGWKEPEVVYEVLSLGTFERVAPEWMREVLMFSLSMCPVFFRRISRVINIDT